MFVKEIQGLVLNSIKCMLSLSVITRISCLVKLLCKTYTGAHDFRTLTGFSFQSDFSVSYTSAYMSNLIARMAIGLLTKCSPSVHVRLPNL